MKALRWAFAGVVSIIFFLVVCDPVTACAIDFSRLPNKDFGRATSLDLLETFQNFVDSFMNFMDMFSGSYGLSAVVDFVMLPVSALQSVCELEMNTLVAGLVPDPDADMLFNGTANSIINNCTSVIAPVAFLISGIAFAISLGEATLKYEIFDGSKFFQLIVGLGINGCFIALSTRICRLIYRANYELSKALLSEVESEFDFGTMETVVRNFLEEGDTSGLIIIGFLVDIMRMLLMVLPILLMCLVLLIVALVVQVKLNVRMIEVILMICVSPAFFACANFESTKSICRNFILSFIGVVVETSFMAVTWLVGMTFWQTVTVDTEGWTDMLTPMIDLLLIPFALGWVLIFPPKAVKNALQG